MYGDIDNSQGIIDVRDIIERIEELDAEEEELSDEDVAESFRLSNLLEELRGAGGDHQWLGDWYPVTLIRDSYFQTYAQDLAEDIGAVGPATQSWPLQHIDWEAAAEELKVDYSEVEYGGITYWYL